MIDLDALAEAIAVSSCITVTEARARLDDIMYAYRPPGALTVRDFFRPDWLPALEAEVARRCAARTGVR